MKKYEDILKQWFGFEKFRDKQLDIIKAVLENKRDVCAIMFTGFGKSLCFQFPAIYTNKTCLVVSPLISLMKDQKLKLDAMGIPCCCLNSTVYNKNALKEEILENEYRLVYTTPEYLITQEEFVLEMVERDILCLLCLDEAHILSLWGNDFREAYKKLNCLRDWVPNIPIVATTATATKRVQNDIVNTLQLKNPLIIKTTFDRPNLIIKLIPKGIKPMQDLLDVLVEDEPTIVYCQTRNMTDEISADLQKNGIVSESYHAGMGTSERNQVHEDFSSGKINCIVATIAFGMGIDITIRKVIHYGIPKDMESYYQEIGRAGRDGLQAHCYLFYALSDMNNNNYFLNQIKNITYRNHMMQLSLTMKNYIFSSECRRKYILEYFGEEYKKDNCGSCDNCDNVKSIMMYDFSKDAKLLFDTINLTGNAYGGLMVINVLRGSGSKKIPYRFKKSNLYGAGTNHTEKWWRIFITIIVNNMFVKENPISGGHAFTLSNTKKSTEWLNLCKAQPETKLLLPVPEDMKRLLPNKTKPSLKVDTDVDDKDTNGDKNTDMIESIHPTKSIISMNTKLTTTYDMFHKQGKPIKTIATSLNVNSTTIEGYIVKLYEKGYDLDLNKLKFTDDIYKLISDKIIELNNPTQLGTIKSNLPHHVSYLQIKLSMAKMEKDKDNKNKDQKIIINDHKIIVNDKPKIITHSVNQSFQDEYVIAKGKKKKTHKNDDHIFCNIKINTDVDNVINVNINKIDINTIIKNINNSYVRNKSIDDDYNKLVKVVN